MTDVLFSEMGFDPNIQRALETMGFETATDIQAQSIPPIRAGLDVLARSRTGTGKTLAFAIPAIESIIADENQSLVRVVILCPTRELAQQAGEEIRKLARYIPEVKPVEIYGGAAMDKQCIRLRQANIVIGTPGRIMDHMRRKTLKLGNLKMIILDEADEMLNMGFKEDIESILSDVPDQRQTVLFSATMPPAILALTKDFQREPVLIDAGEGQVTHEEIEQKYVQVAHSAKTEALIAIMELHKQARTIVFCNTKTMVDELTEKLHSRGFAAESIHSDIRQSQRTAVMQGFKSGKTAVLVATDIAARGIDARDVDFVINFDLPFNAEYYIHRIGRTGRAGKSGCSITICGSAREASMIRAIALKLHSKLTRMMLPTAKDVEKSHSTELATRLEKALGEEPSPMFSAVVRQLSENGYGLEEIAEAALRLGFASKYKTIPKAAIPEFEYPVHPVMTEKKREFGKRQDNEKKRGFEKCLYKDYATIIMGVGSHNKINKNHILGAMIEQAGLAACDIGKIDIYHDYTIIEIPPENLETTVTAMADCCIRGIPARPEILADVCRPARKPEGGRKPGKKPYSRAAKSHFSHK